MRVRLAVAAASLAVLSGATLASAGVGNPVGPSPVTVTTNNGGVQVGTALGGQPLLGARVGPSGICVGFSYQIPFCLPLSLS